MVSVFELVKTILTLDLEVIVIERQEACVLLFLVIIANLGQDYLGNFALNSLISTVQKMATSQQN
jgi:hypothetical protein